MSKQQTYFVKGMHCASCEVLIEKKLLEIPGVVSAEASTGDSKATIGYDGQKPDAQKLNDIFKKDNYAFFESKYQGQEDDLDHGHEKPLNPTLVAFNIAIFVMVAFLLLERAGVSGILNVTTTSSLVAFFAFGLLAGLSSCAALVGGIVLSMSKQWHQLYPDGQSYYVKMQPHIMFNTGRILSYALLGGLLGLIGSRLQISLGFTSFLVIAISLLMVALGLQMLDVPGFRKFRFATPKAITRRIVDESNFKGKHMPFVMGALTFFLPCGFTITAQTLALLSGNPWQGAGIMGFFALGTLPMLLLIGLSSVAFFSKPHLSKTFSKVAGFLVLFFALFTLNNQISVLGINLPGILVPGQNQISGAFVPVIGGKQVMVMTVFATNYNPDYFKVRVGIPVRWEITSSGQPSCDTGQIIANGLIEPLYLNPNSGQVTVKEFTPKAPGTYRFSCPMGMVRGVIEVVN